MTTKKCASLPTDKSAKTAKQKRTRTCEAHDRRLEPGETEKKLAAKPPAGSLADIIFISQPELTRLQTRISGVASVMSAVEMGVLKLTWGNTLNLRDELLDAVLLLEAKLEIPF